ncbi:MAG: CHAP domain-containing protein [Spirochaetes bacterium]|nr:CHAP domain-containing protein [Spirochaetota bacterium]
MKQSFAVRMTRRAAVVAPASFLIAVLSACATGSAARADKPAVPVEAPGSMAVPSAGADTGAVKLSQDAGTADAKALARFRERLLATATGVIGVKYGQKGVLVAGKSFDMDCIGTVSALFWGAGVDITVDFGKYDGNGVARLYASLEDRGALRDARTPEAGDVVFWDDTWDRNGDGTFGNDPLTHAGVILKIDGDGTAHYIHANIFKGVTIEFMNLGNPGVSRDANGKIINSPLYMASWQGNPKNPPRWTSGDLFKIYGDGGKAAASFGIAE